MFKMVNNRTSEVKYFTSLQDISFYLAEEYTDRDSYDELIDDCYNDFEIFGATYTPSEIIKKVDPYMYEYSFSEYVQGMAEDYCYELKRDTDEESLLNGYNWEDFDCTIYEVGGKDDE